MAICAHFERTGACPHRGRNTCGANHPEGGGTYVVLPNAVDVVPHAVEHPDIKNFCKTVLRFVQGIPGNED